MRHVDVLILGPIEAHADGTALPLGRRKQRALLALLACERNRVVSVERIVDELWPDDPPVSARHSVAVYASGLRSVLGEERVERRGDGYLLRLEPDELDAERLAALIERAQGARPGRARRLLEQALALVRGEPLGGVEGPPFAAAERARLGELVLRAREALMDAALALGEHAGLVPELRALCAEHPTRERPRAQLMLALYRSGRQEDALAVYREARHALREELGVEPGPELRELERRILRHDRALAPPTPPPLASSLPAPMHPLLGRDRELEEVAALVRSDARLVTLTGPPGVGKTRLAIALGHALLAEFEAGAVFVSLAPVREPEHVLPELARALDIAETADPLDQTLARHLQERELLLVVDNVEHVLDAATELARLLAACPEGRMLATSRTPLRLYGEHLYPLEPLALPDPAAGPDAIAAAPSVSLFAARARAVRPGFTVADDAGSVAAICRRLDGLPLAIELVAGQAGLLAPALLLEQLASRLDAGEGPRDAPERQRTLRTTLAWSLGLLDGPEQALFRRLGVFVGGVTPEAAAAVCAVAGEEHVVPAALQTLAAHNLLRQVGSDRYEPLETVREYALEELDRSGEGQDARDRHVAYFLGLAEWAEPQLYAGQPPEVLARLNAEHANFLAAAGYAAAAGRGDLELRLLAALMYHFVARGTYGEGRRLLDAALARDPGQPAGLRARAAAAAATLAVQPGSVDEAERLARLALELGDEANDDFVRFKALDVLGSCRYLSGDAAGADAFFERSLSFAQRLGNAWAIGTVLNNRAAPLMEAGAYEDARPWLEASLEHFRSIGSRDGSAAAHLNLGIVAGELGRVDDAVDHLAEAIATARDVDPTFALMSIGRLAGVALALGQAGAAAVLLGVIDNMASFTDWSLEPIEERALRRVVAGVHSELGVAEEDSARAEGRALGYEEAVDRALAIARSCRRRLNARQPFGADGSDGASDGAG